MYKVGQEEVDAVAQVLLSGKLFRYGVGNECARFEERYAEFLGAKYVTMTSSGTASLTAALAALNIGPGDEVLVPACTYIATAIAVLAVGAIPVVVDIDESVTMSPKAAEAAIGPRTRAIIPVHMWGLVADMDAFMDIARRRNVFILEDACQCVGGGYKGRMAGAIGHAGAFSFNYYKNMTCGEGGAVVTNSEDVSNRVKCMVDCCSFYWNGREKVERLFVNNGSRASEIEGALLNCQLDRIKPMIEAMRGQKKRMLAELADTKLVPIKANSLDYECGTHVGFTLPSAEQANRFAELFPCMITGKTGRHVYTEWDPIIDKRGAHHPALNPYNMKENAECRKDLFRDQFPTSLDILNRTICVTTNPDRTEAEVTEVIEKVRKAAEAVL